MSYLSGKSFELKRTTVAYTLVENVEQNDCQCNKDKIITKADSPRKNYQHKRSYLPD